MADRVRKDWRDLCVAVTNERDSTKLTSLLQELIEALDRNEQSWRNATCPNQSARVDKPLENDLGGSHYG